MRDPKNEIITLAQRGQTHLEQAQVIAADAMLLDSRLMVGRLALRLFQVDGRRSLVAIGRILGSSSLVSRTQALARSYGSWFDETLQRLRTISAVRKNLTSRGNSALLAGRFARTRRYKRLDIRINHAVAELEAIAEEELVYNDEISEFKAHRRKVAMEERRLERESRLLDFADFAPGLEVIRLTNREELRSRFAKHAEVGRMIEGALDAYSSQGADAGRQALASCRSAMELLVMKITGEANWRDGLAKLVDGARKRLVSQTYGFLSGYGSHPGGSPTRRDVAYGIRLTIASCLWLIEPD